MSNAYERAMDVFSEYKSQAGNPLYVGCFGKTFIDQDSEDYATSQEVGRRLIEEGFGVIHGGYTGVMEAISRGADSAIETMGNRNEYYNIGVPCSVIKGAFPLSSRINLPEVDNVLDRAQVLIDSSDAVMVMPSGGVGTLVEMLDVFHQNQLNQKFGGRIKPIVCVGGKWQQIMACLLENLNMTKQSHGEDFIFYVHTPKEAVSVIKENSK